LKGEKMKNINEILDRVIRYVETKKERPFKQIEVIIPVADGLKISQKFWLN
jgi:hypothetical protein